MSIAFLTLCLLCVRPVFADPSGYPGGGTYPGGGSGGTPAPDPGHYWKITYSNTGGKTTWAVPDSPFLGLSAAQEHDWNPTDSGGGTSDSTHINGNVTGSVTATLTWIPAAGKSPQSDPPSKMVSIEESGTAQESPGHWNGDEALAPTPAGSASNGLGDAPVAWCSGYISTGTHRVRKDGTSGTITLGPFTLTATCPVSNWVVEPEFCVEFPPLSYEYYHWDWMGGLSAAGFSAAVVPPARPVNFRCTKAEPDNEGVLHYEYAWDSSTGNLADLDGCEIKERVSYENNVGGVHGVYENTGQTFYIPPPPFEGIFEDPEIYGDTPGTKGSMEDDHYVPKIPGSATIPGLYQYGGYNATQEYIYTDDNSDPDNPNDYTVLRGPIAIDRTVHAPGINWIYEIIKYDVPEGSPKPYARAELTLGPIYPQFGP
jgi:hypothetical protein